MSVSVFGAGCAAPVGDDAEEANTEQAAAAACYVAFVHGKRDGRPTTSEVKAYWDPTPADTTYSFPHAAATAKGCKSVLVRYDGTQHFSKGAIEVGDQLSKFISDNAIPTGNLVVVAHSMGGLATRFILNNAGTPLLFPANWATVKKATKYLITSQTPHLGSKGADAVAFETNDGLFGDVVSVLTSLFEDRNGASDGMRRVELEYGSTLGGFMNDTFRTTRIYTIEGTRTGGGQGGPTSSTASTHTANLALIWGGLCFKPHAINGFTCPDVPGDGLVDQLSAGGIFPRSGTWDGSRVNGKVTNYSTSTSAAALSLCQTTNFPTSVLTCRQWSKNSTILGAYTRWLRYGGDHQQGAWDFWSSTTFNYLTNVTTTASLGTYIGANGLNLAR